MNKMGRKEVNDHKSSNTSVSSRPSPVEAPTNIRPNEGKSHRRWFSLRRMFQGIHGQRIMGPRKKKNPSLEMEPVTNVGGKNTPTKRDYPASEMTQGKKQKDSQRISPLTLSTLESSGTATNTSPTLECNLCTLVQPKSNFPDLSASSCTHRSCKECLKQYLRVEITESRVNIACPECPEPLHPNDIRLILNEDVKLYGKYEEFMLRRVLVSDPDARWCPAPDCNFVVIASGCASCPKLTCNRPGCGATFCYHCKQYWHPNQTCDAAKAERSSYIRSSSFSQESNLHNEIKPCPRCQAFIIKMDDGSCNHMTCAICGAEFCWLCMKEISDLHYLSPSGCTFWGKKPWSRKKKILWQLGTLIGAPVGITLIAGIAVPAIIIGVPIWVGKRIYSKCSYMTVHKRNMATVGGVLSSILISPLLAAITVGIGVPILLAYVYGVVPISLCRSGGCGVRTTNSGGVKIDFNEAETQTANEANNCNATFVETRSVADGTHGVANPSIGPSIGEMSLVMTNSLSASGSHLDRVGAIREDSCDRDSASHRAMAGSCIAESLSGSLLGGNSGFQNRLEVQVEMATASMRQDKRSSVSSESANLSIDTKSVTVSFGDTPSVKVADISSVDVTRSTNFKESTCSPTTSDNCKTNGRNDPGVSGTCRVTSSAEGSSTSDVPDTSGMAYASALRSSFQRYGSPPTSRSVSFKAADSSGSVSSVAAPSKESHHHHHHHHHHHGAPETGKYRHYNKKQSMSVGDSIDEERTEPAIISTLDYLSVHSLATRQTSTDPRILQQAPLECCPGGSDIVAMVEAEQLACSTSGSPKLCHQHHYSACQNLDTRGSLDDYCRRFYVPNARISSRVQDAASSCDTISSCNTASTSESNKDSTISTTLSSMAGNFPKINMKPASSLESTCITIENATLENDPFPGASGNPPTFHQHHQRENLKVSKFSSPHLAVMIEADGTDDDENSPIKCPSLVDSCSDKSGGSCTSITLFSRH